MDQLTMSCALLATMLCVVSAWTLRASVKTTLALRLAALAIAAIPYFVN